LQLRSLRQDAVRTAIAVRGLERRRADFCADTLPAADETRAAAETLGISDGVRRHGAQRERRVLLRLGRPRRL
jgi:hypothetical protein